MRYEENPFVEVEKLADGVWSLLSPGGCPALCYLVEGTEKAMLIDTGFGVGDTKALCERLTDKPLVVVDTHSHGDHILGNFQFDKVYIHRLDAADAHRMDKDEACDPMRDAPEGCGYTKADYVPCAPYELIPIDEGYVFDLGGGHEVEVIHTPGHTPGGICLLEKKRRMLFTGDSLVRTPTLIFFGDSELNTVEAYHEKLVELQKRESEFDALYPGHFETPRPVQILDDMVELASDGIISFSGKPFGIMRWLGGLMLAAGLIDLIALLIAWGVTKVNTGWPFGIAAVLCVGGINLLALGVCGVYFERMYDELKGRPLYIVRQVLRTEQPKELDR